jgi:hypothetical protein
MIEFLEAMASSLRPKGAVRILVDRDPTSMM